MKKPIRTDYITNNQHTYDEELKKYYNDLEKYNKYLKEENLKMNAKIKCFHDNDCKYSETIDLIHSKIKTNKDYFVFTEAFCLLHDGKDYCDCALKKTEEELKKKNAEHKTNWGW